MASQAERFFCSSVRHWRPRRVMRPKAYFISVEHEQETATRPVVTHYCCYLSAKMLLMSCSAPRSTHMIKAPRRLIANPAGPCIRPTPSIASRNTAPMSQTKGPVCRCRPKIFAWGLTSENKAAGDRHKLQREEVITRRSRRVYRFLLRRADHCY